ncbi:MAG TPA: hypothetical protein VEJ68_03060 [Candidatus Bathyarchaeia archaeon]|nr:hypothetical protein [Candidatus Bathyarchaeia archaeon]
MRKEFCHICKEGGKECIDVDTKGEVYLEMYHIRCAKCGAPLVS